jgi:hypothetical protein
MDPHDLAQGHGKHLVRIAFAYVLSGRKGQPLYIAYIRKIVFGSEIYLLEPAPIKRDVSIDTIECGLKPLELRLPQIVPGHALFFGFPDGHGKYPFSSVNSEQ